MRSARSGIPHARYDFRSGRVHALEDVQPSIGAHMLASFSSIAVVLAGQPKGGLPQLNPADFAPQLIWLAITFLALWWLMAKVALPKVGSVLEERAQRIQRDLDEAARLKAETEKALADYEASLAAARSRASGIAKDIRDKLAAEVEDERTKVERQVAQRTADAERRIDDMKTRALAEVGQIASDTTEAIVAELTAKAVGRAEVEGAIKAVMGK
jgi:F-type H+-transporting ATPase subunit b